MPHRRAEDLDAGALRRLVERAIGPRAGWRIERTASGGSTPVYRLTRGTQTLYLRAGEDPSDRMAAEALAHRLLLERGVRVPEVVHVEAFDEALDRSVMITTALQGRPVSSADPASEVAAVMREAGRDLARLGAVPVDGFGFVRRDREVVTRLEAPYATSVEQAFDRFEERLACVADLVGGAAARRIDALRRSGEDAIAVPRGRLAHGDVDPGHVFRSGGRYTGLIDLGEMRGAHPFWDLAHVLVHDGEALPAPIFDHVADGYADADPSLRGRGHAIAVLAVAIGVQRLALLRDRTGTERYRAHLVRRLRELAL